MNWTFVESSNIYAVATEGRDLYVRFISGGSYVYFGAGHLFNDLVNASSCGAFLSNNIKGIYDYQKL